jgi:deoxycytidylate deaminase
MDGRMVHEEVSVQTLESRVLKALDSCRSPTFSCECLRKSVEVQLLDYEGTTLIVSGNGPSTSVQCTGVTGGCGCVHAEVRVILAALRCGYRSRRLILVSNYSPCTGCANLIVESGLVNRVFYDILTEHDVRGVEILRASGIRVVGDLRDRLGKQ